MLRIGVLTDLHLVPHAGRADAFVNEYDFDGVGERIERALETFARERVGLVLVLGDLAHDGEQASLRRALRLLRGRGTLLLVGGNHDGARPTDALAAAGAPRDSLAGWRARRVADGVRVAGVAIACDAVDSCRLARPPSVRTWGSGLVVLASHFPVLSREREIAAAGLPYAEDLEERAALAGAVAGRAGPTLVLCGHLHVRDSATAGTLLQLTCGALVESPFDATVVTIETAGERVSVERVAHELGAAPERRNPRLVPVPERWAFDPGRGWRPRDGGS